MRIDVAEPTASPTEIGRLHFPSFNIFVRESKLEMPLVMTSVTPLPLKNLLDRPLSTASPLVPHMDHEIIKGCNFVKNAPHIIAS